MKLLSNRGGRAVALSVGLANTQTGVVISNTTNVASSATGEFKLFNESGSTNVIIDILGTFSPGDDAPGEVGPEGPTGPEGPEGDVGPAGASAPGLIGPAHLAGQDDRACADVDPQEVWARTDADREFVVQAAQDGSGYVVTRYDLNGTFTTVDGAVYPACGDTGTFSGEQTGTWNGVWTRKVVMTADLDYNPEAVLPATATWNDVFTEFFDMADPAAVDPVTLSYEFDYYNSCGDHWRDAFYGGNYEGSGTITDCP